MENAIINKVKNQANHIKTWSDELQVQMALGKAEARDSIERERKNLSKYFHNQKNEIDKIASENTDNRRNFLTTVENLESSLNQKTPTEVAEYDSYKNDLLSKIYKLEDEVKSNYPTLGPDMQNNLENFKAKMDAFRVNLALHDKDNPEKVAVLRSEFTDRLTKIRTLLNNQETAQTKLDNFVQDISESYSYLKRAISDLSK